jgi:hypothetical protein
MIRAVCLLAGFLGAGGASLSVHTVAASDPPRDAQRLDVAEGIAPLVRADWIAEDLRFGRQAPKRSEDRPVTTAQDAAGAVDGVTTSRWGFHTASGEIDPWWQVDLTRIAPIKRIVVYNRTDGNTAPRTRHMQILVAEQGPEECSPQDFRLVYQHDGSVFYSAAQKAPLEVTFDEPVEARVVRLMVPGPCSFALVEVEVYAADDPDTNIALGRPADQKSTILPPRIRELRDIRPRNPSRHQRRPRLSFLSTIPARCSTAPRGWPHDWTAKPIRIVWGPSSGSWHRWLPGSTKPPEATGCLSRSGGICISRPAGCFARSLGRTPGCRRSTGCCSSSVTIPATTFRAL